MPALLARLATFREVREQASRAAREARQQSSRQNDSIHAGAALAKRALMATLRLHPASGSRGSSPRRWLRASPPPRPPRRSPAPPSPPRSPRYRSSRRRHRTSSPCLSRCPRCRSPLLRRSGTAGSRSWPAAACSSCRWRCSRKTLGAACSRPYPAAPRWASAGPFEEALSPPQGPRRRTMESASR